MSFMHIEHNIRISKHLSIWNKNKT